MAIDDWPSSAELIRDCARLGYLKREWHTLDPTHGRGVFWKLWRPNRLVWHDILEECSSGGVSVDFRHLPWAEQTFDAVVFDPPYKLNGTPTKAIDERYGVDVVMSWRDRMKLIAEGTAECCRVCNDVGYVLVKCQDQVVSQKVRWQTSTITEVAEDAGFGLVDRFDAMNYRPQPPHRTQEHARHNASQLLVFKRGFTWK